MRKLNTERLTVLFTDRFQVLSHDEASAFIDQGYVVVRGAFSPTTAEQLLPFIWARLEEEPDDPSTWNRIGAQIEGIIHEGPFEEIFTSRYNGAVDDLVGKERWSCRRDGFGWVIVRFPTCAKPWAAPSSGWHVDGIDFQHRLTSPEQGLVGIELFTDVEPGGGGTAVKVGSHRAIARALAATEPHGLSYAELRAIADSIDRLPVAEVVGQAGDLLLMHPFLAHARSPNTSDRVRIIANRTITLHAPMNFTREDPASYSLVELGVCKALNE